MTGAPVVIGPFVGGLNTYSEPTAIGDDEAVDITNMDIDLDGSLVNRPPVGQVTAPINGSYKIIGTYTAPNSGAFYLICYSAEGNALYAYNTAAGAWTSIKYSITATAAVQYMNKLWVVADVGSASAGGSWDPSVGWTQVTAIPRGVSAAIYKERMFIASGTNASNPSRLYFSDPTDPNTWPATNTADVSNGDGQDIIALYVFNGQIVVFKTNSTYTYGYDSSPNKGVVQRQSGTVGLSGSACVAEFENSLYVLHSTYVYQINNWNWEQLNVKVPFKAYSWSAKATTENFSVSVVNNRLICRFFENYYIYGLKTRAWSLWRFNTSGFTPSKFIKRPVLEAATGNVIYYADSYAPTGSRIYYLYDTPISTIAETFTCSLTTKTYDYNSPYSFKRLFHWGVDCLGRTTINFRVYPTVYNLPVTWGQLLSYKWSQMQTWRNPISRAIDVTSAATLNNPSGTRSYIKIIKSLRFRQISFTLSTTLDGTVTSGPFRVFKLSAFTSNKELVSKQVS